MRKQKKCAVLVMSALAGVGLAGGGWLVKEALDRPQDAYAMQGAAELVISHLQLHTNQWPRSWTELSNTHAQLAAKHLICLTNNGVVWERWDLSVASTLEEMERRIELDWNADITKLRKSPFTNPIRPFRAIKLKDGRGTHFSGGEPNAMIWEYLQSTSIDDTATNKPAR